MPISPLRQRMIDDMTARHFGEKSQKDYIRCVLNFTLFIGRSPDTATLEDLQRFRLHLTGSSLSPHISRGVGASGLGISESFFCNKGFGQSRGGPRC